MSQKHWSIETALEQIRKCDFECEGGPIANNEAWQWLEGAAKVGPKFWPGQGVFYQVAGEIKGIAVSSWAHFFVVGCLMSSDTEGRLWHYSLSNDPPGPWHYGDVQFSAVAESKLFLVQPELVQP